MAVHTASPPEGCADTSPVGVLKRTIVPNTVVCKATVGYFRDTAKEDLALSFENSVQLLHLSNGLLQEISRQDLHARAKTIDTLSVRTHDNWSKGPAPHRDLLVVLTDELLCFLLHDNRLQRFLQVKSIGLSFSGYDCLTVDPNGGGLALWSHTHNWMAFYLLKGSVEHLSCSLAFEAQFSTLHLLHGAPCFEQLHSRPPPVLGPRPLEDELRELAVASPCSIAGFCYLSEAGKQADMALGHYSRSVVILQRWGSPGSFRVVVTKLMLDRQGWSGDFVLTWGEVPDKIFSRAGMPASITALPGVPGGFLVVNGHFATLYNSAARIKKSGCLQPCDDVDFLPEEFVSSGQGTFEEQEEDGFSHAVAAMTWERTSCGASVRHEETQEASGSRPPNSLIIGTLGGRLARIILEWNGFEGQPPAPSDWEYMQGGFLTVQVAEWDAKSEINCLASIGGGLFVSTLTGHAYLGAGWHAVSRLQDTPLGTTDNDSQHVMPAGLLKHFVVADLLNENQNQIYAASGVGEAGCVQVIRGGQKLRLIYESSPDEYAGVTRMWTLHRTASEATHSVIILSFISATRALAPGVGNDAADLTDVTECIPLAPDSPTIACGRVADGLLVQVTPEHVLLCSMAGLPEAEFEDPQAAHGDVRRRTPSFYIERLTVESGEESGEELPPHVSPPSPSIARIDSSWKQGQVMKAPDDCWAPESLIGAAAVGEGLVVVCSHDPSSVSRESCLFALEVVVDRFGEIDSPGKRKRVDVRKVLVESGSLKLKADASCLDLHRAPSRLGRHYSHLILLGSYEPGLQLVVLTTGGSGGPKQLISLLDLRASSLSPQREPPLGSGWPAPLPESVPESIVLLKAGRDSVQAMVGWRNGAVMQLLIRVSTPMETKGRQGEPVLSPATASVRVIATVSTGHMPAVVMGLPRSRRAAEGLSTPCCLVASDRLSLLKLSPAGERMALCPLSETSVACMAPLWLASPATALHPARIREMILAVKLHPAAEMRGGSLELLEVAPGPPCHLSPIHLGVTPSLLAALSQTGLLAVVSSSPLDTDAPLCSSSELLLLDPASGAVCRRDQFLPGEVATSVDTLSMCPRQTEALFAALRVAFERQQLEATAAVAMTWLSRTQPLRLVPDIPARPSIMRSASLALGPPMDAADEASGRGEEEGPVSSSRGHRRGSQMVLSNDFHSSEVLDIYPMWPFERRTPGTASVGASESTDWELISRPSSTMTMETEDSDTEMAEESFVAAEPLEGRWPHARRGLLLVGTQGGRYGIAGHSNVKGRVLVMTANRSADRVSMHMVAQAKLSEPVLSVCAYKGDRIIAATPSHLVAFQLTAGRLKKLQHQLFRNGLRSVTSDGSIMCLRDNVNGAMLFSHNSVTGFRPLASCLVPRPLNCSLPCFSWPSDPGGSCRPTVVAVDAKGWARVMMGLFWECSPEDNIFDMALADLGPCLHLQPGDLLFRGVFGTRRLQGGSWLACTVLGGVQVLRSLDTSIYAVLAALEAAMRRNPATAPPCGPPPLCPPSSSCSHPNVLPSPAPPPLCPSAQPIATAAPSEFRVLCAASQPLPQAPGFLGDLVIQAPGTTGPSHDVGDPVSPQSPPAAVAPAAVSWPSPQPALSPSLVLPELPGPPVTAIDGDLLATALALPPDLQQQLLDDMRLEAEEGSPLALVAAHFRSSLATAMDILYNVLCDLI